MHSYESISRHTIFTILIYCLPFLVQPLGSYSHSYYDPSHLSDLNADSIELTQSLSGDHEIRLRCDARGSRAADSLVLLGCPLTETKMCRENCTNPCPSGNASPQCLAIGRTILQCKYQFVSSNHITTEYLIETSELTRPGHWWCIFRGKRSNSVLLEPKKLALPEQSITTKPSKVTKATKIPETNLKTRLQLQPVQTLDVEAGLIIDIPPNIMILILAFVLLSIAFNVFFFIRCWAVNKYLKKLHYGKSRNCWYDNLLCVDQPRRRRKSTNSRFDYIYGQNMPGIAYLPPGSNFNSVSQLQSAFPSPVLMPKPILVNSPAVNSNRLRNMSRSLRSVRSDATYDEVHNSVYTPLEPSGQENGYQGPKWLVDHNGCVYMAYSPNVNKFRRAPIQNMDYTSTRPASKPSVCLIHQSNSSLKRDASLQTRDFTSRIQTMHRDLEDSGYDNHPTHMVNSDQPGLSAKDQPTESLVQPTELNLPTTITNTNNSTNQNSAETITKQFNKPIDERIKSLYAKSQTNRENLEDWVVIDKETGQNVQTKQLPNC